MTVGVRYRVQATGLLVLQSCVRELWQCCDQGAAHLYSRVTEGCAAVECIRMSFLPSCLLSLSVFLCLEVEGGTGSNRHQS